MPVPYLIKKFIWMSVGAVSVTPFIVSAVNVWLVPIPQWPQWILSPEKLEIRIERGLTPDHDKVKSETALAQVRQEAVEARNHVAAALEELSKAKQEATQERNKANVAQRDLVTLREDYDKIRIEIKACIENGAPPTTEHKINSTGQQQQDCKKTIEKPKEFDNEIRMEFSGSSYIIGKQPIDLIRGNAFISLNKIYTDGCAISIWDSISRENKTYTIKTTEPRIFQLLNANIDAIVSDILPEHCNIKTYVR
ncbi:MAG: hypothetical protein HY055_09075 [Magnetospirillum sp.]|nr:hypothetical protein [Magnetospirillum sp.]